MNKQLNLAVVFALLAGCGNGEDGMAVTDGSTSTLASNDAWPYQLTGEIDIIEMGIDDSDYPNWAIGIITVGDEQLLVEFSAAVMRSAGIGADFAFEGAVTIRVGQPNDDYGTLTYPVEDISL